LAEWNDPESENYEAKKFCRIGFEIPVKKLLDDLVFDGFLFSPFSKKTFSNIDAQRSLKGRCYKTSLV
jgi:hypothetical protein